MKSLRALEACRKGLLFVGWGCDVEDEELSTFSPILQEWCFVVLDMLDILTFLLMDLTTKTMLNDMKLVIFVLQGGYRTILPTMCGNQKEEMHNCCGKQIAKYQLSMDNF